jgi:hypothetical protein
MTLRPAPAEIADRQQNAILTIGVLFFIFGFVTWLNGPLITFVKLAFHFDDVNAFLMPMAFYLSYFFLALPSSIVLRRTGMKKGMALGLLVMAFGASATSQRRGNIRERSPACLSLVPGYRSCRRPPIPMSASWDQAIARPGASQSWAFATSSQAFWRPLFLGYSSSAASIILMRG